MTRPHRPSAGAKPPSQPRFFCAPVIFGLARIGTDGQRPLSIRPRMPRLRSSVPLESLNVAPLFRHSESRGCADGCPGAAHRLGRSRRRSDLRRRSDVVPLSEPDAHSIWRPINSCVRGVGPGFRRLRTKSELDRDARLDGRQRAGRSPRHCICAVGHPDPVHPHRGVGYKWPQTQSGGPRKQTRRAPVGYGCV